MSSKPVPLTEMNSHQLLVEHNVLAATRGCAQRAMWSGDRMALIQRIAILRATKPTPADAPATAARGTDHPGRYRPVRRAVLEALCFVTHFEEIATGKTVSTRTAATRDAKTLVSVGLPYPEVLERVKRVCPGCKTTGGALRFAATMIRNGTTGYEAKLPHKRPHGTKGRKRNG